MISQKSDEAQTNRRVLNRRGSRVSVVLRTKDGRSASGTSVDLSLGGLQMVTAETLGVGDCGIAQVATADGSLISVDFEVVWRKKAVDVGGWSFGLRFPALTETQRFAILAQLYAGSDDRDLAVADKISDNDRRESAWRGSSDDHGYYLRLLRRIEQVHKLAPSVTDALLFACVSKGASVRDALLDSKVTDVDGFDAFMSAVYDVPFVDLRNFRIDPSLADALPANIDATREAVAVERQGERIVVAMADPLDLPLLDSLRMKCRGLVDVRFALIDDIRRCAQEQHEDAELQIADRPTDAVRVERDLDSDAEIEDLEALRKLSDTTPVVTLVDSLLRSAVEAEASDIHLEPWADKTRVRFRLDGVLHTVRTLPHNIHNAAVSRIKILSRMDITVRHIPQDGRASIVYAHKDFDLRVSSLPTHHGEKIVIRLLEKNPTFKTMDAVGFNDRNYKLMAPLIHRPHGMVLCCGPTGSGKSTTLFAVLQEINDGTSNITTIEDPIEYSVEGVNQVEVSAKRGLTFGSVLRSLLRQDPDVIYVGEIRDRETADLAVRAALTGHLLLSTLHTNSAVQAIARLIDIGADPALIGASLLAVVGQRLLRKICLRCKEAYEPGPDEAALLEELMPGDVPKTLFRGKGCGACHETGYRGRMPVHEVIVVDDGLRRLIAKGADSMQLLDYAKRNLSFAELRSDALDRMVNGL